MTTFGDKDVGGLDVAMHNAGRVGRVQRVGNFDGQVEQGFSFQWPSRNSALQGQAIEKLHGDKRLVLMLANLVDRANVGMIQGRGGAGFAAKPFQRMRIIGHIFREELERDEAPEFGVFGLVHDAHAPATEFLDHPVMRDGLADH